MASRDELLAELQSRIDMLENPTLAGAPVSGLQSKGPAFPEERNPFKDRRGDGSGPCEVKDASQRHEKSPRARALEICSFSEKCSQDLAKKLRDEGYEEDAISDAVGFCSQAGALDDSRYATLLAQKRARTGKGPFYVERELQSKGLNAGLIEGWPESIFGNCSRQAEEAARLIRDLDFASKSGRDKALQKLTRRGFSNKVCLMALEIASTLE